MKYSVQVVIDNGWKEPKDVVCTCGHRRKLAFKDSVHHCPKCEECTIKTVTLASRDLYVYMDNRFEVISKSDSHFHIRRQKFDVQVTRFGVTATPTEVGELRFSMKTKEFTIFCNGKLQIPTDTTINQFFKCSDNELVVKSISTPHNEDLFRFCYKHLGRLGYERQNMWGRALKRLKEYPGVEVFGLSPMRGQLRVLWEHSRDILKRVEPTSPHKLLGVPKFAINYLTRIRFLGRTQIKRIQEFCQYFDGNSVKMTFEILDDESDINMFDSVSELLIELHKDYGYKDLKRTVLYISREVKLEQGILTPSTAVTLLRDYARMCTAMGTKFNKYPKSLKKDHDVALMNYKANEDEFKQKEFSEVVTSEEYATLEYKSKEFSVIYPTHVKDVISEGDSLSHCVSSYVDDIIKKKCKILFLRKSSSLDEPLVTVEVRGNHVRQIRGQFNRRPSNDELEFVNLWAEKKELVVQNY